MINIKMEKLKKIRYLIFYNFRSLVKLKSNIYKPNNYQYFIFWVNTKYMDFNKIFI